MEKGCEAMNIPKIESTSRKGWRRANEKHIMTGLGIQKRQRRRVTELEMVEGVKCDNLRGRANVAGDDKPSAI